MFGIYLAVALPILIHLGSQYWFMGDEWAFLAGGSIANPEVLFRPLHLHWVTIPTLVYRALYSAFGLHSYLPFQLCVIFLHLTLCCLVRTIMRRVGVGPWTATIFAAALVLFGVAEENILAGIQISLVGSLVFGFTHMLLADHDGRIDWRDWLGLLCGLASIMSSGMGPPMVAIVGLAAVCRRGWIPALFHTLPLAMVYTAWFLVTSSVSLVDQALPPLELFVQWVIHGQSGVFLALGGYDVVAVALSLVFVMGLIIAWRPLSPTLLRQRASLPVAMLVGALVLQIIICRERWVVVWWLGLDVARTGRYLGVYSALTLPALAVAADALVRRWRWMMPVVYALVLVGIGVNVTKFGSNRLLNPQTFINFRTNMLAIAYSPLADQAPADLKPYPNAFFGGDVDMAFLLEARDSGRLPPPPEMTATLTSQAELRLSVRQLPGPIPADLSCAVHSEPMNIMPEVGALYGFTTPVLISLGETGAPLTFISTWGAVPVLQILRADLTLHLAPKPPATNYGLCF